MILISFKIHVINPIVIKNRIDTIIIKREAVMPNLWDIQVFFKPFNMYNILQIIPTNVPIQKINISIELKEVGF